jgi:hypothetical protein
VARPVGHRFNRFWPYPGHRIFHSDAPAIFANARVQADLGSAPLWLGTFCASGVLVLLPEDSARADL